MSVKEYSIFCIFNGGKPFYLDTYNDLITAKLKLYDMISLEKERHRPFYVHNDFFENDYPSSINGKFFSIKVRTVSEWETYSDSDENQSQKNNIIYLKKC